MDCKNTMDSFNDLAKILQGMGVDISRVPDYVKISATDIHIAVGQPVIIYCFGMNRYTVSDIVSRARMDDIFFKLCDYSVYKHTEEIRNGFITINEKYRCGICGTCVRKGDEVVSIRNITSINIRVPHHISGVAEPIVKENRLDDGVLIIGEPSSGKTTLLRDIAANLPRAVVVDERYELGIYGTAADVMLGYNKASGISQAIRTMSPGFIVCDELDYDDIDAVKSAVSTGVSVIASVHGKMKQGKPVRGIISELVSTGAFGTVVVLKGRLYPSSIERIYRADEFCEAFGCAADCGKRDPVRSDGREWT